LETVKFGLPGKGNVDELLLAISRVKSRIGGTVNIGRGHEPAFKAVRSAIPFFWSWAGPRLQDDKTSSHARKVLSALIEVERRWNWCKPETLRPVLRTIHDLREGDVSRKFAKDIEDLVSRKCLNVVE
jgi:hypothetical protein